MAALRRNPGYHGNSGRRVVDQITIMLGEEFALSVQFSERVQVLA